MGADRGYSELYEDALRLAAIAHRRQNRIGSDVPYITHPLHVSVILLRDGFPIEVAIAGLLHDVVEDQGFDLAEIESNFGSRVAGIVAALSERKRNAEGESRPWEVRKREGLARVAHAGQQAAVVKVADALHNARSTALDARRDGAEIWQHFTREPGPTLDHYREILRAAHGRLHDHPPASELADAIEDLARAMRETGVADESCRVG